VLGTGGRLRFLSREVTAPLALNRIGFEVMDTAACRSFMGPFRRRQARGRRCS